MKVRHEGVLELLESPVGDNASWSIQGLFLSEAVWLYKMILYKLLVLNKVARNKL